MGISPRPESGEGLRGGAAAVGLLVILGEDARERSLIARLVTGSAQRAAWNRARYRDRRRCW